MNRVMRAVRLLPLLLLALAALAPLAACEAGPAPGDPALPPGFKDALLPQAPLSGYLYLRPEGPIAVNLSLFTGQTPPAGLSPLPEAVGLEGLRAWLGPSPDSFGLLLELASAADADALTLALETSSPPTPLWHRQEGDRLFLVAGSDAWADGLKTAIEGNQTVALPEAYPQAWETIRLLPERPPSPAIAAGFVLVTGDLIEAWATRAGVGAQGVTSAASYLGLDTVALAGYGELPSPLTQAIRPEGLTGLEGVFMARSSRPGFLLSFLFGQVEGRAPVEKTTVGEGATAYSLSAPPFTMMLTHRGPVVIASAASSPEAAASLLLVAMGEEGP